MIRAKRFAVAIGLALVVPSAAVVGQVATAPPQTSPRLAIPSFTERSRPKPGADGIEVGQPKVCDSQSLQQLINAALLKLAALNPYDQSALANHLGSLQGATASQTQFGLQANSLASPGSVTTATNAGPTQTQTSTPSTPPLTVPTPSQPSFALPTGFAGSSLDLLSEEAQLGDQITELQLLMGGSLTDEVGRLRLTVGFPISIAVPQGYQYRNAVAEVEVTVCTTAPPEPADGPPTVLAQPQAAKAPAGSATAPERVEVPTASLVRLLPLEKTYNVANVISKTGSIPGILKRPMAVAV
jgi:hypothetical protein